jgi:hypothetical protein
VTASYNASTDDEGHSKERPFYFARRAAGDDSPSVPGRVTVWAQFLSMVERNGMQRVLLRMFAVALTACCTLALARMSAAQVESNTSINMKGLGTGNDAAAGKGNPFFTRNF